MNNIAISYCKKCKKNTKYTIDDYGETCICMECNTEELIYDDITLEYIFSLPLDTEWPEGLSVLAIKDGKYGYINKSGEWIIKPIFEIGCNFSEGLAMVLKDGKCGYINKSGEWIIEPKYDKANNFSEGLAAVGITDNNDRYGFIDKNGNIVIDLQFASLEDFSGGLAAVEDSITNKCGYIDKKGNIIIPFEFDYAESFIKNIAKVGFEGKNTFIDKNGNLLGKHKPKRNDPCPCGSGKKYKKCCMNK